MPRRDDWQTRIKAVEREYLALRQVTDHFQDSVHRDPTILQRDVRYRDLVQASNNLEGTYVIRLFAEFESGLRQYWDQHRGSKPRTRDLLTGLAALRTIPDEKLKKAHEVREWRNYLIHEHAKANRAIPIAQARGYLCTFLSFLPAQW
jgi:hypothetical protein